MITRPAGSVFITNMSSGVKCLIWYLSFLASVRSWEESFDPDGDLTLDQFVRTLGYELQRYKLEVSDGYIITVIRIKREGAEKLKPIMFVHGMTACADSYFVYRNSSPPIVFANRNYDVWILSSRGTIHSLGHTRWNSSTDREFWKYSWQEMGTIDLPAAIDLALTHNQHKKLALVGHSEGSIVIFVNLAERPEYNEKVAISFHWGASIYHTGCNTTVLSTVCRMNPLISRLTDALGLVSLMPTSSLRVVAKNLCRLSVFTPVCKEFFKEFAVVNDEILKEVDDPSFVISKAFCGGSIKELMHYFQLGHTGIFAKFDYGPRKNLEVYNSRMPPLFNLKLITSPVVIWCGSVDQYCNEKTISRAVSEIPNVVSAKIIGKGTWFGHVDFLLSPKVHDIVFNGMFELLEKFLT